MLSISQDTQTRASACGVELVLVKDRVEVRQKNRVLAFGTDPDKALSRALSRLEDAGKITPIGREEEPTLDTKAMGKFLRKHGKPLKDAPTAIAIVPVTAIDVAPDTVVEAIEGGTVKVIKGSIIKSKYKEQYRKHGFSCGDMLADELKAYVTVTVQGRPPFMDVKLLKEVATKNGVWHDKYDRLNSGQQRMNVGNRLRNKYKNGDKIDIGGVVIFDESLQDTGE